MAEPTTTAAAILRDARALGVDRLDTLALLEHHGSWSRAWLLAHDDEALPPAVIVAVQDAIVSRARGVPLAYLVGRRGFHALELEVSPAVLVPRPETELLVTWALELLSAGSTEERAPLVVDLGTGSGAIALAIKNACPRARLHAVDASELALAVARRNAARLGLEVQFHQGDWWQGAWLQSLDRHDGGIDLVVTNPPYIPQDDPHLAALTHEPSAALVAGVDGLDAIRTIVRDTRSHLRDGGALLLEHGFDQASAVRSLLTDAGFDTIQTRCDLAGHERCTGGRRRG